MVKRRRAEHPGSGETHSPSQETRVTAQTHSAKPQGGHDATLPQASGHDEPSRRRSSRGTVKEQTKASELTAAARHARQLPLAGTKRKRSSDTAQDVAGLEKRRASTPHQRQQHQVTELSSDSTPLQRPQEEPGVSSSSADSQQAKSHAETTSKRSVEHSQPCRESRQNEPQVGSASVAGHRQPCAAKLAAVEQPAHHSDGAAADQPVDDSAFEAQAQTPDSPRSEVQQSPKGKQRRVYGKRTHGTPHAKFQGVKTSTAGVKHMTVHPDVKQIWSAFVMMPSKQTYRASRMLFLGKNYWSAEAAARAVDRANIALYGREAASTNFPLEWYGPEVHSKPVTLDRSPTHAADGRPVCCPNF